MRSIKYAIAQDLKSSLFRVSGVVHVLCGYHACESPFCWYGLFAFHLVIPPLIVLSKCSCGARSRGSPWLRCLVVSRVRCGCYCGDAGFHYEVLCGRFVHTAILFLTGAIIVFGLKTGTGISVAF